MNIHILSEFAYHIARGGVLMPCAGGYRIENPIVCETGDYNAFYANSYADLGKLKRQAAAQLEQMGEKGPFDIQVLDGDVPANIPQTLDHHWVSHGTEPIEANLRRVNPDPDVYWAWYESTVRQYPDFEEDWWECEKISHGIFISQFRPIWYLRRTEVVGRLYRFDTFSFTRLFSMVVDEQERGKGYGVEITSREVAMSRGPVLIRAHTGLKPFYEKSGFAMEYTMPRIHQSGPGVY